MEANFFYLKKLEIAGVQLSPITPITLGSPRPLYPRLLVQLLVLREIKDGDLRPARTSLNRCVHVELM